MRSHAVVLGSLLVALPDVAAAEPVDDAPLADRPDPAAIYGGGPAGACAWPTTVSLGGCTGTLVHPEVVVYAAHCGSIGEVFFGDAVHGEGRTVVPEFCEVYPGGGPGSGNDWAVCKLSQPVTDIAITPPLMGCETELLVEGQPVWIVGFGNTDDGNFGVKYEALTQFHYIENDEAFIGGGGIDTCQGDSGGPVYIELDDGSWRAFGITSYGDGCGGGGWYSMMHTGMAWFESTTGVDITPCHEADGTWNPGPACTGFAVDPGTGAGSWPACRPAASSSWSASCGPPYAAGEDDVPPSVSITAPTADAEIPSGPGTERADVLVEISADDGDGSGVRDVQLVVDGIALANADEHAPYRFVVELDSGVYTLSAIATDLAGNSAESAAIDIGIDEAPAGDEGDDDGGSSDEASDEDAGDDASDDRGIDTTDPALPAGFGLDGPAAGCGCASDRPAVWAWLVVLLVPAVRARARAT